VGIGWSLSECGDTFNNLWTLTGAGLTSLFIDAGAGDSVFDTSFGGLTGTAGSALGVTFNTAYTGNITATYSGPVALTGNPPVGDLFRFLRLDFTGGALSGTITFGQDTDNLGLRGDLTPLNPVPVPEPASLLLLGSGLVGAVLRQRRRAARTV
jgi:hypothetical protein